MGLKGREDLRSFTVLSASKHGGCKTKSKGGRYVSTTPLGAAKKAFNALCRVKKIRGVCTLTVVVKETTTGSANKEFSYTMKRKKLSTPLVRLAGTKNEFLVEYEVSGNKTKGKLTCKNKGQSTGKISSRRSRRLSALRK